MINFNPGNVLSFRTNKRFQRHRLLGQDYLPFGLTCPQSRLLPFQLFLPVEETPEINFTLVNAADESETITQDVALLEIKEKNGGSGEYGFWVTWKAGVNLTTIPACGFWYVKIGYDDQEVYSEVLHCKPDASFDRVGIVLVADSCVFAPGDPLEITVAADDDLSAAPVSQTIEAYLNDDWQTIGPSGGVITLAEFPPNEIKVRRIVQTVSGQQLTIQYIISWSDAESPCDDIHIDLDPDFPATTSGGALPERWRLRMKNETDKGNVLYQTGYEQQLYIKPVFDRSDVERNIDKKVSSKGNEISRYTRTVERLKFEAPDIPDYVAFFLSTLGDLSSVILEDASTGIGFELLNTEFTARPAGPSLNIGEFSAERNYEVFSGCQPNYALAE